MSQGQQWFLLSPRFPSNLLFTSASGELWKMVRIGGQPLGFGETHVPSLPTVPQPVPYSGEAGCTSAWNGLISAWHAGAQRTIPALSPV